MMTRYLVRSSRVRIISIRTKVTISISNQSLTIAKLLHSARHNVEHLFNITQLQYIHLFSLLLEEVLLSRLWEAKEEDDLMDELRMSLQFWH